LSIEWPSLTVCKPAYSELASELGNREGCGKKGIQHKKPWGAMVRLIVTLICVAAAGLLVVIQ